MSTCARCKKALGEYATVDIRTGRLVHADNCPSEFAPANTFYDGSDFDDAGWTNYDWRTALNPDEGDHF